MNIMQYLQFGNIASTSYKENAATNGYTAAAIGGVSVPAVVYAALHGLAYLKPELGLTDTLIATVTAIVGAGATQVIPWIQHLLDMRKAAKAAAANADLAVNPQAFPFLKPSDPPTDPSALPPITDDTLIVSYLTDNGMHASGKLTNTIGKVRKDFPNLVSAVTTDGREWKA